jgi:hypothetical protein
MDEKCAATERHSFIHNFIFISFTYLLGLYSAIFCIICLKQLPNSKLPTVARPVTFFVALGMVSYFSFSLFCWNCFHSYPPPSNFSSSIFSTILCLLLHRVNSRLQCPNFLCNRCSVMSDVFSTTICISSQSPLHLPFLYVLCARFLTTIFVPSTYFPYLKSILRSNPLFPLLFRLRIFLPILSIYLLYNIICPLTL